LHQRADFQSRFRAAARKIAFQGDSMTKSEVWLATSVLALGGCAAAPPPQAAAPGAMCDLARGRFKQTSSGPCPSSTWTFELNRVDGRYRAHESGCANATGTAAYDGGTIILRFEAAGTGGVYTWPLDGLCRGGAGTVAWTSGPLEGQKAASTLEPEVAP
jgi:hypothetical protein